MDADGPEGKADCYSAGERAMMVFSQTLRGRLLAPLLRAMDGAGIRPDYLTLASLLLGTSDLTDDRLVQRTRFGDAVEVTANFSDRPSDHDGERVPARSVPVRHLADGRTAVYTPAP